MLQSALELIRHADATLVETIRLSLVVSISATILSEQKTCAGSF